MILALCLILSPASVALGGTFVYEIKVKILYPVVQNGKLLPDTPVWGMPSHVFRPNGKLELSIDEAGNVMGATLLDPVWGVGTLQGQQIYALEGSRFQITRADWGNPTANLAPITSGMVDLVDTFLGDFSQLEIVSGFIRDSNSGSSFDLTNGLGSKGILEFTAVSPEGVSLFFSAQSPGTGTGTGWYPLSLNAGNITYANGPDRVSVDLANTTYNVFLDARRQEFHIMEEALIQKTPTDWFALGRSIDEFQGTMDFNGNFSGTVHFAGAEFSSLSFSTTDTLFHDGNSELFDASCNGLAIGDTFDARFTDDTGKFQLLITGTLLEQIAFPCPATLACPGDCAPVSSAGFYGDGLVNILDLITLINNYTADYPPCDFAPVNADGTTGDNLVGIFDLITLINAFGPCPDPPLTPPLPSRINRKTGDACPILNLHTSPLTPVESKRPRP